MIGGLVLHQHGFVLVADRLAAFEALQAADRRGEDSQDGDRHRNLHQQGVAAERRVFRVLGMFQMVGCLEFHGGLACRNGVNA